MLSSSASSPPRDKLSSMTQNGPRSTLSIRSGLFRPNEGKTASPSHSASHCLTRRSRCSSALRQRASTSFRAATTTIAQWLATMSRQWCSTPLAARQQCMAAGLHFATGARAKASTPQWQKSALCTRSSQCRPHIRETTCLSADDPSCSNGQMRSCR